MIEIKNSKLIVNIMIIYLFLTIVLYFLGPIDWQTKNTFFTFFLVIIYILSIKLGNYLSNKKIRKQEIKKVESNFFSKYFWLLSIITITINVLLIIRISSLYGWNSIPSIISGIINDYKSLYFAEKIIVKGSDMFGGTFLSLANLVCAPITILFLPLSIINFNKLSILKKMMSIVVIIFILIYNLSIGTTEGIFKIVIYIIVGLLFIKKRNKKSLFVKKKNKNIFILMVLLTIIVIAIFNQVMQNRTGGRYNFSQLGENTVNTEKFPYNIIPNNLVTLLVWLDFYICQGYYGMSLATTLNWYPMLGAGFSRWLCMEVNDIFGGIYNYLYSVRIESVYNWGDMVNWHSAFTWIANDLSWFGVPFVMIFIGWMLSETYKEAAISKKPVAIGLFMLFLQMIFFLPANNIVFANSTTFFSFFLFLVIWLYQKKYRKQHEKQVI